MHISATDSLYPHKSAILLNPASGRLRRHIDSIRALAAAVPGACVRETGATGEIEPVINELKRLGADHLIIAGGDGTVQMVLNHLCNSNAWTDLPPLSIVPGGTTNMTAADIGITGNPARLLEKLGRRLRERKDLQLVTRPVLKVEQRDRPPLYGMFFGTGLIARSAAYFQNHVKKTGVTGESASTIAIARTLLGLLSGRRTGEWASVRLQLRDNSGTQLDGDCLMLFASTLDRLLLGMKPYWGPGAGPLHTSCIKQPARYLWWSLLKILFRRGDSLDMNNGYYSRHNEWIDLTMDDGFIIDGEFFDCDSRNGPLRITATGPVRFLSP